MLRFLTLLCPSRSRQAQRQVDQPSQPFVAGCSSCDRCPRLRAELAARRLCPIKIFMGGCKQTPETIVQQCAAATLVCLLPRSATWK
eukprot:2004169-Amphidinium_carterae.1